MPRATRRSTHSRQHLKKLANERNLEREMVEFLNARHDHRERLIPSDLDDGLDAIRASNDVRLELIAAERDFLYEMLRDGKITDELRRRLERDLDLEEAAILARREGETPLYPDTRSVGFSQRSAAPTPDFFGPGGGPYPVFPFPLNEGMERREAPGSLRGSPTDLARVRL